MEVINPSCRQLTASQSYQRFLICRRPLKTQRTVYLNMTLSNIDVCCITASGGKALPPPAQPSPSPAWLQFHVCTKKVYTLDSLV